MMVMCIYQAQTLIKKGLNDKAQVHIGNIYTVENVLEYNNEDYYKLQEVEGAMFFSGLFAPLSNEPVEVIEEPETLEA